MRVTNETSELYAEITFLKRVMGMVCGRVSLFRKKDGLPIENEQRKKYWWTLEQWEELKKDAIQ